MGSLLFSAKGAIGRNQFWTGLLIIAAISLAMSAVQVFVIQNFLLSGVVGLVASIVLIWMATAVFSKRFHDAGMSGWLAAAVIFAFPIVTGVLGFVLGPLLGVSAAAPLTDQSDLAAVIANAQSQAKAGFPATVAATVIWTGLIGLIVGLLPSKPAPALAHP